MVEDLKRGDKIITRGHNRYSRKIIDNEKLVEISDNVKVEIKI